ncbi:MAG TPA: hypothetical protein VK646_09075 [Actinomycetota bacterium]|nr:hypothetical protein [Actinomycetota bacterium]
MSDHEDLPQRSVPSAPEQPHLPEPPREQHVAAALPTTGAAGRATTGPSLVVAGGVLVVVGALLPWITASGPMRSVSINGLDAGGWAFLLLGGFALARGASMRWPDRVPIRLGTPLIGGVLLAGLLVMRWGAIQDAVNSARTLPGVTASLGVGLWATIAGIAAILAGGLLAGRRR